MSKKVLKRKIVIDATSRGHDHIQFNRRLLNGLARNNVLPTVVGWPCHLSELQAEGSCGERNFDRKIYDGRGCLLRWLRSGYDVLICAGSFLDFVVFVLFGRQNSSFIVHSTLSVMSRSIARTVAVFLCVGFNQLRGRSPNLVCTGPLEPASLPILWRLMFSRKWLNVSFDFAFDSAQNGGLEKRACLSFTENAALVFVGKSRWQKAPAEFLIASRHFCAGVQISSEFDFGPGVEWIEFKGNLPRLLPERSVLWGLSIRDRYQGCLSGAFDDGLAFKLPVLSSKENFRFVARCGVRVCFVQELNDELWVCYLS